MNGMTVKGVAQNHVKATMTAACEPFSLPSIGAEIVLFPKDYKLLQHANTAMSTDFKRESLKLGIISFANYCRDLPDLKKSNLYLS